MAASPGLFRRPLLALLLAVAFVSGLRAEDDFVNEPEPKPAPEVGNQAEAAQVIIMPGPGLRLRVGGVQVQGQFQVPRNVAVPAPFANGDPAGANRKQPYLGVVTGEVSPAVRAQLDLPDGIGLSIEAVAAGGPAEKAGVKQFDVIRRFNDQEIVSPEQLTTLVNVAGAGTTVPLTLLRGGREKVVEAVLEERGVAADEEHEAIIQAMPGVLNLRQMIPAEVAGAVVPQMQADIERKVAEALARAGAGGGMPPGATGKMHVQTLMIGPNGQSDTTVRDARGTVEIRSVGGKKTVTVKDPQGEEVHSGPLDNDKDLEKVPEDYRDWVREVDGGQPAVKLFAPEALDLEGPEKDEAPAGDDAEAGGPAI